MTKERKTELKDKMKAQLIAACESVIRNADAITDNYTYDQNIKVIIEMTEDAVTLVKVIKRYIPKEVIEAIRE